MGHQGMRREERAITSQEELRSIVERAQVLHIGSHDDEGPFITPLSYGYDWEDGVETPTFWVHCASSGRKVRAWTQDQEVGLELDLPGGVIAGPDACSHSFAYESVMATGRMSRVRFDVQKRWGLRRLMEHMAPGAPTEFSAEALAHVDVWRIDVSHISGKRHEAMGGGQAPRTAAPRAGVPSEAQDNGPTLRVVSGAEVERILVGEKCPGCGMHCPLFMPSCPKGAAIRDRRLAEQGARTAE